MARVVFPAPHPVSLRVLLAAALSAVVALTLLALAPLADLLLLAGRLTGWVHLLVLLRLFALTHPRLPVTPR